MSVLPQSKLFWGAIGLAVVLVLLGMFAVTGPMAGILGVWGATVFLTAVLGYVLYRVWYVFES